MVHLIGKAAVIAEIKELYNDIDKCISDLITARGNHDGNGISNAHWRMETLMVNTQQAISNVIDTFEVKEVEDAFIDKACEWLKNNVEKYYYLDEAYDKVISIKNLNNDFKKYMEGE